MKDCEDINNFDSDICKSKRLKENCSKFNGKVYGKICKIDGFPMKLSDNIFLHDSMTQQHKVMSPKDFLELVPPEPFNNKNTRNFLKKQIETEKGLEPTFLDVDVDKCKVLSHEGRNRAIVSQELGIKKIPVVIFNKEFNKDASFLGSRGLYFPTKRKNKCNKFVRQDF